MREDLPNFVFGAIYRSASGQPDASASAARFRCYTPASADIPPRAWVADCWVCDAFGRIDPGLSASPIPVRKQDLGRIINVVRTGHHL